MQRVSALAVIVLTALPTAGADIDLVVPFTNRSKSADLEWIGVSISETVREALLAQGGLAIRRQDFEDASRRLSLRPSQPLTTASIAKLGKEVEADRVVYGHFELLPAEASSSSRGSLRITARILNLKRVASGPEFGEVGALEDLAALQTHLAWQALQFLIPGKSPSQKEFLDSRAPVRIDVIENYIRGLLAANDEQKHRLFTQAARLNPDFSPPAFQLGLMQWAKKNYRVAAGWLERVAAPDIRYLEANSLLGLCRYHMGDYEGAQKAFAIVAESMPLGEIHNNLGVAQLRRNLPEALDNLRRALSSDPSDPDYHFNVAYALWKRGDFEAAADGFRESLDRRADDPDAIALLGRCLQKSGPRPGDRRSEGLERLKEDFEETAYRQRQALLEAGR